MPPSAKDRRSAILAVLQRRGAPVSRSELAAELGVARATLNDPLAQLLADGVIAEDGEYQVSGGRPSQAFGIVSSSVNVGVIDVGGSRTRVGMAGLDGVLFTDDLLEANVEAGPVPIMKWAVARLAAMFEEAEDDGAGTRVVVVGLPGPVDFTTGEVVSPPIMGSWQGFDVRSYIEAKIDAPVIIDNDVNLIALAEQRFSHPESKVLLVIKLGTGVGGGLVIDGRVLRGARGAAGDIGHTQATRVHKAVCRCGNTGCVEAVAGGWAIVQRLKEQGFEVENVSEVARLARDGDPVVMNLVREAVNAIALSTAQAVSLLNPDTVSIAGELLGAGDVVVSQIRKGIYQYSLPLATRELTLAPSTLGPLVGLMGGAQLGIDYILGAAHVPQLEFAS